MRRGRHFEHLSPRLSLVEYSLIHREMLTYAISPEELIKMVSGIDCHAILNENFIRLQFYRWGMF